MCSLSATSEAAELSSDEFIPVVRRRNRIPKKDNRVLADRHRTMLHAVPSHIFHSSEEFVNNIHELDSLIGRAKQRIQNEHGSFFLTDISAAFADGFQRYLQKDGPNEIVCYALGRFSVPSDWSFSCRLQLILLVELAQFFKVPVYIYDPAFSNLEKHYLRSSYCGFEVIDQDEKARWVAKPWTLFYMIHADSELYMNLFQFNFEIDTLANLVLFGNSIQNVFPEFQENASPVKNNPRKTSRYRRTSSHDVKEPNALFQLFGNVNVHTVKIPDGGSNGLFWTALSGDTFLQFLVPKNEPGIV
ncbi:uncharacterized protein LOC129591697 [Paramacrobiotus metropolitanus]|uniref:uncharacterized protein LOC129591697 n=1 Tax=Paramacrobiotus metropolitanus TaxID=2943436 RepID=UPI00244586AA|nr:uncharacterized protein LOC129591697 [Paramacrobiotus metropolitanus]